MATAKKKNPDDEIVAQWFKNDPNRPKSARELRLEQEAKKTPAKKTAKK